MPKKKIKRKTASKPSQPSQEPNTSKQEKKIAKSVSEIRPRVEKVKAGWQVQFVSSTGKVLVTSAAPYKYEKLARAAAAKIWTAIQNCSEPFTPEDVPLKRAKSK